MLHLGRRRVYFAGETRRLGSHERGINAGLISRTETALFFSVTLLHAAIPELFWHLISCRGMRRSHPPFFLFTGETNEAASRACDHCSASSFFVPSVLASSRMFLVTLFPSTRVSREKKKKSSFQERKLISSFISLLITHCDCVQERNSFSLARINAPPLSRMLIAARAVERKKYERNIASRRISQLTDMNKLEEARKFPRERSFSRVKFPASSQFWFRFSYVYDRATKSCKLQLSANCQADASALDKCGDLERALINFFLAITSRYRRRECERCWKLTDWDGSSLLFIAITRPYSSRSGVTL